MAIYDLSAHQSPCWPPGSLSIYHKYLLHISQPMLASWPFSPRPYLKLLQLMDTLPQLPSPYIPAIFSQLCTLAPHSSRSPLSSHGHAQSAGHVQSTIPFPALASPRCLWLDSPSYLQ